MRGSSVVTGAEGTIAIDVPSDDGRKTVLAEFKIEDDGYIKIEFTHASVARSLLQRLIRDELVGLAFTYSYVQPKEPKT